MATNAAFRFASLPWGAPVPCLWGGQECKPGVARGSHSYVNGAYGRRWDGHPRNSRLFSGRGKSMDFTSFRNVSHKSGAVSRPQAVDLPVLGRFTAITKRRLFVPLPLRNDVADLVVGQASQHSVRHGELPVDARLDRHIGKVTRTGSVGSCTSPGPAQDRSHPVSPPPPGRRASHSRLQSECTSCF